MKKLLGISLVAVLAATPLMANATVSGVTVDGSATANVASTSYVQGAYNAMATAVNSEIDALDATVSTSNENRTDGLSITITEENGKITGVTGSIANGTYLKEADIAGKADTSYVNTELAKKIDKTAIDAELDAQSTDSDVASAKAAYTAAQAAQTAAQNYTNTQLESYTNTTDMNSAIATAKSQAIETAAADATTKAGNAEAAAKTYAEGLVTGLGAVATQGGVDKTIKAVELQTTSEKSLTGGLSTTNGSFVVANSWNDATDTSTKTFLTGASADYALSGQTTVEIKDSSVSYTTANPVTPVEG